MVKKRYACIIYAGSALFIPGFVMLLITLSLTALYMDGFITDEAAVNRAINFFGSNGIVLMLIGGIPVIITGVVMMLDPPKESTKA